MKTATVGDILRALEAMGIEKKGYDLVSPYERKPLVSAGGPR